jgi:hypothetical protein
VILFHLSSNVGIFKLPCVANNLSSTCHFPVRVVTWALWAKVATVAAATVATARVRVEVA